MAAWIGGAIHDKWFHYGLDDRPMTFLNPLLLAGLAAVAIPIAIHLIARREPKRIVFGSIGFLAKKYESSRTRMQVRRYWLLAMRIMALAAFAMALAVPAVASSFSGLWWIVGVLGLVAVAMLATATWMGSNGHVRKSILPIVGVAAAALLAAVVTGGYAVAQSQSLLGMGWMGAAVSADGPVAVGIVIDNGPAAAYHDDSGSHLERMKAMVHAIAAALPRTSRVALVDRSSVPPAFAIDASGAVKRAENLEVRQQPRPLADRIEATRRLLMTSDLSAKHVIVLTGRTETSWRSLMESGGKSDNKPDGETPDDTTPENVVSLHVVDTGEMTRTNVALSALKLAEPFPPAGSTVPIAATVSASRSVTPPGAERPANADQPTEAGDDTVSITAELQWLDDDASLPVIRDGELVLPNVSAVDRAAIEIPIGGSSDVVLSAAAMSPGIHHGQLRLTGQDSMPLDDVRYVTLQVPEPADILIVSDDLDEAYVMEQTIQASSLSTAPDGSGAVGKYRIATIGSMDLAVARLSDFVAVVLMDPSPKSLDRSSIDRYVAGGGSVFAILGPRMTAGWKSDWLPDRKRVWRMGDDPTFFEVVRSGSGIAASLASDVPWNLYPVQNYWQIGLGTDSEAGTDSETGVTDETNPWDVIIRYAGTGHPALLSRESARTSSESGRERGGGRVLVLTTPMPALAATTRSWNDLFGGDPWPAWLLVRRAMDELALGSRPRLNLTVGEPLVVSPTEFPPPNSDVPSRMLWYRPDETTAVPLDRNSGNAPLTLTQHDHAGRYWIRGDGIRFGYSVNLDPGATALTQIPRSEIPTVPGFTDQEVLESIESLQLTSESGAGRTPLKSPILLLALSAFLIEQYLGNRFYGKAKKRSA